MRTHTLDVVELEAFPALGPAIPAHTHTHMHQPLATWAHTLTIVANAGFAIKLCFADSYSKEPGDILSLQLAEHKL